MGRTALVFLKSSDEQDMRDLIFIDIESSGLHRDSYPIEIALRINSKTYCWLIKPEPCWQYWCDRAETIHGLSLDFIHEHGLPAKDVALEVNDLLSHTNGMVYSDAAPWDDGWMQTLFFAVKESANFQILSLQNLMDEEQLSQFKFHFKRLAQSGEYVHHRAADDAEMIQRAYMLAMQVPCQ